MITLVATNLISLAIGFLLGRILWALTDWRSSHTVKNYQHVLEAAILWSASQGPGTAPELCERVGFRPQPMYAFVRHMVSKGLLHSHTLTDPESTKNRGGRPRTVYILPQQGA